VKSSRRRHPSSRNCASARQTDGKRPEKLARINHQLGVHPGALRGWVRQAEIDASARRGTSTEDAQRICELERELREVRRANEIFEGGKRLFREGTRPQVAALVEFVDTCRDRFDKGSRASSRSATA